MHGIHRPTPEGSAERPDADRLRRLFEQAPGFITVLRGPDHVFEMANAAYRRLVGGRDLIGKPAREAAPELHGREFTALLDHAYATGKAVAGRGRSVRLRRTPGAPEEERFIDFIYQPIIESDGGVSGIFVEGYDATDGRRAEEALRERNQRLRLLTDTAAELLAGDDLDDVVVRLFRSVAGPLGLDVSFNFMVSNDGRSLRLESCAGVSQDVAESIAHLEFDQAVCGTVAATRRPMYFVEVQSSADALTDLIRTLGIRAYACNPLMAGDHLLGTLSFGTRLRDRFSDEDLEFFRTVSHYVAIVKERRRAEDALRTLLGQREALLKETHHRIKNSIASVGAMLRTQARLHTSAETRTQLFDAVRRVATIGRIHQALYLSESFDAINVCQHLHAVMADVAGSTPTREGRRPNVRVECVPDLTLPTDIVTPLSLIAVELVVNAVKHARASGAVNVTVSLTDGDRMRLVVADNGRGFPKDGRQQASGFGLRLVALLAQQLGGGIDFETCAMGARVIVEWPAAPAKRQASARPSIGVP